MRRRYPLGKQAPALERLSKLELNVGKGGFSFCGGAEGIWGVRLGGTSDRRMLPRLQLVSKLFRRCNSGLRTKGRLDPGLLPSTTHIAFPPATHLEYTRLRPWRREGRYGEATCSNKMMHLDVSFIRVLSRKQPTALLMVSKIGCGNGNRPTPSGINIPYPRNKKGVHQLV